LQKEKLELESLLRKSNISLSQASGDLIKDGSSNFDSSIKSKRFSVYSK
jgi:hypothetical protein